MDDDEVSSTDDEQLPRSSMEMHKYTKRYLLESFSTGGGGGVTLLDLIKRKDLIYLLQASQQTNISR